MSLKNKTRHWDDADKLNDITQLFACGNNKLLVWNKLILCWNTERTINDDADSVEQNTS